MAHDGRGTAIPSRAKRNGTEVSDDGAAPGAPPTLLTARQREIAGLVAGGCTNKQIAAELTLAPGTVANHIEAILRRLNLKTRSQITAWALDRGLTQSQDRLLTLLERLLEMSETTLAGVMGRAATLVAEAFQTDKVDLFCTSRANDTLVAIGASDTPMGLKQRAIGMDVQPLANGGRVVQVFQTGVPFRTGRADRDPGELVGVRKALGIRSTIAVALDVDGQRRGVVAATSAAADAFSERDLRFLEAVSRWVGSVVHRAELTAQIAESAAEQGRRVAAEELVTVLAHDLRNYLTPIKGRLDLLRRRAARERRPADLADSEAAAGLAHLDRLIGDLLDVARLEQGMFVLSPRPVDLVALVHDAAVTLEGATVGIRVQAPDEVVCQVDPDRLRQALDNLLVNAVNHTGGASVNLQLTTITRDSEHTAVITVADEGPGIPPELLPRLFERFVAGSGSTGLGLGLYLAKRIADAHGGTLTVDSAPGHGARFALALPCEGVLLEARRQHVSATAP